MGWRPSLARLRDGRWQRVLVLAVTETISWGILYYSFSVLLVPMEASLGASRGELSAAFSVAIVMRALASPLAGVWADRHGVRSLMTAGSVAGVLLTLAWSSVTSAGQLTLVFAGIGVVTAMVLYEPAFVAVARWMRGSDRATAVLWITLAGGFASTIFLPLAATLTELLGWREALRWLALVLLLGTALPHALFLREPVQPSTGSGTPSIAPDPTGSPGSGNPIERSVGARDALFDPVFWWMTLAFMCGRAPMAAIVAHLPALLVDQGESAALAAVLTGSIGALSVLGRILMTIAARWGSFAGLLAAVYAVQAGGLVLIALVPTRAAVIVFVIAFGIGFGTTTIAKPVMVADRFGPLAYGTIAGYTAAVVTIGEAASPIAVGLARDSAGDYRTSLLVLAGVLVVGVYAARRSRPDASAAGSVSGGR